MFKIQNSIMVIVMDPLERDLVCVILCLSYFMLDISIKVDH